MYAVKSKEQTGFLCILLEIICACKYKLVAFKLQILGYLGGSVC